MMSQEIIDTAVFGLMLGATVLAVIKVQGSASRSAYTMLSGFALLSAVSGLRLIDHLAIETLGSENSGLVVVVDVSLTLLGLILILRGVSVWKNREPKTSGSSFRNQVSAAKSSHQGVGGADFFRKLHSIACDLAQRIETLSGLDMPGPRARVSALEALFEGCSENLCVALNYDCLTVELAPLEGTTAHSMTKVADGAALKVSFYPVRQSLAQVGEMENGGTRLIRKSSGESDSICWTRLDLADAKEALLGSIRLDCGYSLTIAAGSRHSNSLGDRAQFPCSEFLWEFLKLVRPLAIVALSQAKSAAQAGETSGAGEITRRTLPDRTISGKANRIRIAPETAPSSVSGNAPDDGLDKS